MQTAFIYARVSTKDQAAKDNSLPAQFNRLDTYCKNNKIKILRKYFDSESAYNDKNRIQFNQMINDALNEYPNYIITDDSSRFSRRKATAVAVKTKLRDNGINIRYANEPYIDHTTIAGLWNEGIQELMNQSSSMQTSFHVLKGMTYNIQNRDSETGWCFKNGGIAPFGYEIEHILKSKGSHDKKIYKSIWIIDKDKYEIIREVLLEMRINKKMSYRNIRDELNKRIIKTNNDKLWSTSSVTELFKKARLMTYAGYGIWNKTNTKIKSKANNAHESIITLEELEKIEDYQKYNRSGAPAGKSKGSCFLFTGYNYEQNKMFTCSKCGSAMVGDQNHNANYYKYSCGGYKNKGSHFCNNNMKIDRDWLENLLIMEVVNKYKKPDSIDKIISQIDKNINTNNTTLDSAISKYKKDITKIDEEIKNLVNAIKNGIDPELMKSEIEKCTNEKNALIDTIKSYEKSYSNKTSINVDDLREFLSSFELLFEDANKEQRRELIRTFIRHIYFNPENKEISVEFYDDTTLQSIRYGEPYHK
jgi:site-specific DNA recombinase